MKRELIFAFTDVLVYIGGTAGLFLGCSLLSLTELLYFLTWRFFKSLWAIDIANCYNDGVVAIARRKDVKEGQ